MRIGFIFLVILSSCTANIQKKSTYFTGWAMTMPYQITLGSALSHKEQLAIDSLIQTTFAEINSTVNNWNPESEISSVNQAQANVPQKISEHLTYLIELSSKVRQLSQGKFDPTIEPLMQLWKRSLKQGIEPSESELAIISEIIGWKHLHIQDQLVWKDRSETKIDLCALSKGYGVDLLLERLYAIGYKDLLVEWAGEIRAAGKHPDGRDWMVQIEPAGEIISLENQAIATSGDYAQKEWGSGYFHIINPLTAKPMVKKKGSIAAATAIAPTCALADALATTLMLFETEEEANVWANEVIKQIPEVKFWIFTTSK